MTNYTLVILILMITVSEAVGQFLLNLYHLAPYKNITHYGPFPVICLPFVTWLLYGLCTFLLLRSYEYSTMGKVEVYWDALSALIVPVIGVIYFSNNINIIGWTGIVLIIIGTMILGYEKEIGKYLN